MRLARNPDYWKKDRPYLDAIEFIDYGEEQNATVAALEAGEIDANYQTTGETVTLLDGMDLVKSEAVTASTIVIRTNVNNKPYDDKRVRNALQLAVEAGADAVYLGLKDATNARNFAGPAQATITIPQRIPPGFHGNWLPDA